MKTYWYYPGCSLRSTGRAYEESLFAVFRALDASLKELDDWNCCGATSYASIDEMQAFSLGARNLALAEIQNAVSPDGVHDLVVPCNACYLVLTKTQKYMQAYENVRRTVDRALEAAGLHYGGTVRARHPIDVLVNDIGLHRIAERVTQSLSGKKFACYYGCQIVRPFAEFDDGHDPTSMDMIVKALGGEALAWSLKTRCCGGSLTGTIPDAGLPLNRAILSEAAKIKADAIVTCCPLCQFNLECFQKKINALYGEHLNVPVLYFTQLMGMAFGISDKELGIQRLLIRPSAIQTREGGVKAHG